MEEVMNDKWLETLKVNSEVVVSRSGYQSINTLVTIESLFGLVFIAFLAASLHRRISTRRD